LNEMVFDGNIISTCMNQEAAHFNFPLFMHSSATVEPPITPFLIIFCLDDPSCIICRESNVLAAAQCVYLNLGLTTHALAPGGTDESNRNYWRLTYGRVYATLKLSRLGINAIPVDIDAFFLQNPLIEGNGLFEHPNDVAVVQDIAPFTFKYGDKTPINGGFLYFPGVQEQYYKYSKEILDRIWSRNCEPDKNEQLVTSSVLRYMSRRYSMHSNYNPHMLSAEKYHNYCSTTCGTGLLLSSAKSVGELDAIEKEFTGKPGFEVCEKEARKKWVYFHAACLNKDGLAKTNIAQTKNRMLWAVFDWAKAARKAS
jgi:hypothetical protein